MTEPPGESMVPARTGPLTRRMFLVAGAAAAVTPLLWRVPSIAAAPAAMGDFGFPPPDRKGRHVKSIVFPVLGPVSWVDTFGACRGRGVARVTTRDRICSVTRGRSYVAAVSGTIVVLRHRKSGNSLYIKSDSDGWFYGYLHINNDRPGTDDGHNAYSQAFAPHVSLGAHVRQGQHIAYLGDSGNAETTSPHCHFEIRKPASSVWHSQAVNAKYSLDRGEAQVGGERIDGAPRRSRLGPLRSASDATRRPRHERRRVAASPQRGHWEPSGARRSVRTSDRGDREATSAMVQARPRRRVRPKDPVGVARRLSAVTSTPLACFTNQRTAVAQGNAPRPRRTTGGRIRLMTCRHRASGGPGL